ncbi:MAG: hypothetical protein HOM90_04960 [Porticoccaceae bacterium]|jgi:hypothetical protein|nr:hypothetical protein [Porticoccaceae bacterium]MBT3797340.1 hypothetical protein [Porticoccaceae bacterium]MBT4165086.1 hypothetical protein [Porticoccaceae bacterium]MBT4211369.1 hypothetical protein [Porticoccaceae bacterium]MBT4592450.1 hypothetical protein [Porticoccaceae bacterium]|tara:strand:+ start:71 stop:691 length:621 start_codon:yes stop_codon:yes gene_type:complete
MRALDMKKIGVLILIALLGGCSSSASVQITTSFPSVLSEPKPINASILIEDSFVTYVGTPNKNTRIDIGASQVDLLKSAFSGLFDNVDFVTSLDQITAGTDLIITPSVLEVQVSTPSDNYLNVFEVWIKYNLDIQSKDGALITNWFLPAYGKTPDSFMASKEKAIEQATVIALRDAGAKLMLDFYRIPAINDWLSRQNITQESQSL